MRLFVGIDFFYVVHRCSHVQQECVGEDEGSHGLYDYYGAGDDDGVVAAFNGDGDGFPLFVYGVLEGGDGRGWFDGCPKDQGAAVTDSAKDSAGGCWLF